MADEPSIATGTAAAAEQPKAGDETNTPKPGTEAPNTETAGADGDTKAADGETGGEGEGEEAVERLIPFVAAYVLDVDLATRRIRVAWQKDW